MVTFSGDVTCPLCGQKAAYARARDTIPSLRTVRRLRLRRHLDDVHHGLGLRETSLLLDEVIDG